MLRWALSAPAYSDPSRDSRRVDPSMSENNIVTVPVGSSAMPHPSPVVLSPSPVHTPARSEADDVAVGPHRDLRMTGGTQPTDQPAHLRLRHRDTAGRRASTV